MSDTATTWTTCLKITRADGVMLGLTELDRPLEIDGLTYLSASGYTPSAYASGDGLAVDNADVEGLLAAAGIEREDIRAGLYDLAGITLFVWDWQAGTQIKLIATGNWGECTLYRGRFVAEFRSLAQKLQQTVGRIYTAGCDAELGDARCRVNLPALIVSGTLDSQTSRMQVVDAARVEADGAWRGGLLTFTGGANAGRSYEVRASLATGHLTLLLPLAYDIAAGDTYTLAPGCDKRLETCRDVYANVVNFRGFHHVPGTLEVLRFGKRSS